MNDQQKTENIEATHFKNSHKKNIRNDILKILKEHKYGINISQIAEELNISRNTVKNYLASLEKESLIRIRKIGRSKLILIVNKDIYEVLLKLHSIASDYLTCFWKSFEREVYPNYPTPNELLIQIGKRMGKDINYPILKNFELIKKSENKEDTIKEIGRLALQVLEMFNDFGQMILPEILPNPKSFGSDVLLLRVEYTGALQIRDTEAFCYLGAGFFEEILRKYFRENIYINVLEVQRAKSCCYYEIGILKDSHI